MIAEHGTHDVILMDDGMQNPYLHHSLTIGVFDGSVGVGNGWLIPAGPLRTPLADGMARLDLAVINGEDETGLGTRLPGNLPVFGARLQPDATVIDDLDGAPLMAFAGIGRPARFFKSLEAAGGTIVKRLSFADHHPYSQHDLAQIQEDAQRHGAVMITTKKDWMRLPPDWRARVAMLPVSIEIEADETLLKLVERRLRAEAADG